MKNLIQITTVLFLLVQTLSYSQTKTTEETSQKEAIALKKDSTKAEVDAVKPNKFLGTYLLEEADFTLEIIEENDKMYIVTSFSKDILIQKNETTLHEPTRGVDLELIDDNKNALKFTQNGYETIIKRVDSKTKK